VTKRNKKYSKGDKKGKKKDCMFLKLHLEMVEKCRENKLSISKGEIFFIFT